MNDMNVHEKVRTGAYDQSAPYPRRSDPNRAAMLAAYNNEAGAMAAQFKADLEAEYGMTGHPKADALFSVAWDEGHAYGFAEVAGKYGRFVELAR